MQRSFIVGFVPFQNVPYDQYTIIPPHELGFVKGRVKINFPISNELRAGLEQLRVSAASSARKETRETARQEASPNTM